MIVSARSANDHPWFDLEADFQNLMSSLRGCYVPPSELADSVRRIAEKAQSTARRLFRAWGVRNPDVEAADAAQAFLALVYERGLRCCDDRPAHRFCFSIYKYQCIAAARRVSKFRSLPEGFDQADDDSNALDSMVAKEEWTLLNECLAALPEHLQTAACPVRRKRCSNASGRHCSRRTSQAQYRATYRVRQRLKEQLTRYRNLDA